MGASQSYEKAKSRTQPTNMFEYDIDDLSTFLNRTTPVTENTLSSSINSDTFKNLMANVADVQSEHNDNKQHNENTENSNKLNEPSNEIITNLENQYNGQTAEIKKINEYRDLLNYDLNVIKNKINKNNKINYNLLIFIILLVIILIPLITLVIVKFVNV